MSGKQNSANSVPGEHVEHVGEHIIYATQMARKLEERIARFSYTQSRSISSVTGLLIRVA